jgi:hypothetical protein
MTKCTLRTIELQKRPKVSLQRTAARSSVKSMSAIPNDAELIGYAARLLANMHAPCTVVYGPHESNNTRHALWRRQLWGQTIGAPHWTMVLVLWRPVIWWEGSRCRVLLAYLRSGPQKRYYSNVPCLQLKERVTAACFNVLGSMSQPCMSRQVISPPRSLGRNLMTSNCSVDRSPILPHRVQSGETPCSGSAWMLRSSALPLHRPQRTTLKLQGLVGCWSCGTMLRHTEASSELAVGDIGGDVNGGTGCGA